MRSQTLSDFSTTDDHLMHIVGLAKDQTGAAFFLVKNSGGTDRKYDGYLYMSLPYFRLKTTALMVNKNSLPASSGASWESNRSRRRAEGVRRKVGSTILRGKVSRLKPRHPAPYALRPMPIPSVSMTFQP